MLLPIEKEVGGIPKSVISDALNKAGLAEHAKKWLLQQGQYYCVFTGTIAGTAGTTAMGSMLTLII